MPIILPGTRSGAGAGRRPRQPHLYPGSLQAPFITAGWPLTLVAGFRAWYGLPYAAGIPFSVGVSQPSDPVMGSCLRVDGTIGFVIFPAFATAPSLVVSCWYRSTATDGGVIFGKYDNTTDGSAWMLYRPNGGQKVRFYYNGAAGGFQPESTSDLSDGNWHHLLGEYRSGIGGTLFVNGVAEASAGDVGDLKAAAATAIQVGNDAAFSIGYAACDVADLRYGPLTHTAVFPDWYPKHLVNVQTRWDLYQVPERRAHVFIAAAAGGGLVSPVLESSVFASRILRRAS